MTVTESEISREALAAKKRCDALRAKQVAAERRPPVEQLVKLIEITKALEEQQETERGA